jgi:hypothetical protein
MEEMWTTSRYADTVENAGNGAGVQEGPNG